MDYLNIVSVFMSQHRTIVLSPVQSKESNETQCAGMRIYENFRIAQTPFHVKLQGLRRKMSKNFFESMYEKKNSLLMGEKSHFHRKISIFVNFT